MVRRKEYVREEVLEKAVQLFWRKGYKASSMTDIVRATGLNTASMYKEFGDKDGLFEEALEYYRQYIVAPRFQALAEQQNINGILSFLKNVMQGAASQEYKGCLIMNHLAQKSSISPETAEIVSKFGAYLESSLEAALRTAQKNGEISASKDPAVLASFLTVCIHGLVLYGRHPDKKDNIHKLHDVFDQVLGA